ncbi:FkbM family methyltransferase [Calothrix sp. FACHB-168]|nr:FkbM family methyltransferase [Calothrix sp. FACHB-168]
MKYLKKWGFQPSLVIDVGAYKGQWTKLFKDIFPESKILMIEGQDSKYNLLKEVCDSFSGEVIVEIALLGSLDDYKVRFCEMETGSSIFEESSSFARKYSDKYLSTIDSLLKKYPDFQKVDFLKIDVQGYELEILKGAKNLIKNTEFILMEVSLIPINKGCPLISDVMKFMNENNFVLLDFCSQIRCQDGSLWQTDLLFVQETSRFVPTSLLSQVPSGFEI